MLKKAFDGEVYYWYDTDRSTKSTVKTTNKCLCSTFFVCLDHRNRARVFSKTELKREAEGYRRIAFPKGGAKTIRTRDQQNHALVARGSYFAIQRLLERLEKQS